jgi:hypothetical protein
MLFRKSCFGQALDQNRTGEQAVSCCSQPCWSRCLGSWIIILDGEFRCSAHGEKEKNLTIVVCFLASDDLKDVERDQEPGGQVTNALSGMGKLRQSRCRLREGSLVKTMERSVCGSIKFPKQTDSVLNSMECVCKSTTSNFRCLLDLIERCFESSEVIAIGRDTM